MSLIEKWRIWIGSHTDMVEADLRKVIDELEEGRPIDKDVSYLTVNDIEKLKQKIFGSEKGVRPSKVRADNLGNPSEKPKGILQLELVKVAKEIGSSKSEEVPSSGLNPQFSGIFASDDEKPKGE